MTPDWFTYSSGAASLVSLALQFTSIFPEYTNAKRYLFAGFLGSTIGSLVGSVNNANVSIDLTGSPVYFIALGAATLLFIYGLYLFINSKNEPNWEDKCTCSFIMFFILLFGLTLATAIPPNNENKLTVEDYHILAKTYESSKNYTKASDFYYKVYIKAPTKKIQKRAFAKYNDCKDKIILVDEIQFNTP